MKRYLLFAGCNYSPDGGWNDLYEEFDSLAEAEAYLRTQRYHWWHVVDLQTRKIVRSKEEPNPWKPSRS